MRWVCYLVVLLLSVNSAFAKSPEQVKSAFLYQIAKFTKFDDQVTLPCYILFLRFRKWSGLVS